MKTAILSLLTLLLTAGATFVNLETHTLKGKVVDEAGPLIGVSIAVKGTSQGCVTDVNGEFSIQTAKRCETLTFSYTGYQQQEVAKVCEGDFVEVKMVSGQVLEEVVITALGMDKAKRSAGRAEMKVADASMPSGIAPGMYYDADDYPNFNTEDYDRINENRFFKAVETPLSTFSIDVDAASYSNLRRFIQNGQVPPADAVRIEEMVNYFDYDYPAPAPNDERPFNVNATKFQCPWNARHELVVIGLQGKKMDTESLPPSNLVFLIDVSGSMQDMNKLPLVKSSMKLLVDQLRPQDRVAMVVYAGAAGLVLPSTSGQGKQKIREAIDNLEAGGSTAGAAGIKLAYQTARENFAKEGNNRVIICTDGDFNVGTSSDGELVQLIENERESGVFLTVLGYGMGNYKDNKMQKLADAGNGNHYYIDNINEGKKVLVNEFGGTLFTIAKDVKIQIEFNPAYVQGYRLIGYENRLLNKEDFNDDKKDAGELGSGHRVTALYEVIPTGIESPFLGSVDPLKYQNSNPAKPVKNGEAANIKLRYKTPDGHQSQLIETPISAQENKRVPDEAYFAAAVAEFGMLLRNSEFKGTATYGHAAKLAKAHMGKDENGYRAELLRMIETMESLAGPLTTGK
ncbi:MAG: von Willebrand factor type A domain-containing protein [Bacteroidetes bacterium]|nr:von Willebrand factor type A domain-containing protein [Bacteroidota bacterium]